MKPIHFTPDGAKSLLFFAEGVSKFDLKISKPAVTNIKALSEFIRGSDIEMGVDIAPSFSTALMLLGHVSNLMNEDKQAGEKFKNNRYNLQQKLVFVGQAPIIIKSCNTLYKSLPDNRILKSYKDFLFLIGNSVYDTVVPDNLILAHRLTLTWRLMSEI
jgi:hypothetical protein